MHVPRRAASIANDPGDDIEGLVLADAVEKVAARRFQSAGEKIDLSDRPTNRSRTSVKDKKTPEVRRVSPSAGRKSAT
jgi:hypothetical protein